MLPIAEDEDSYYQHITSRIELLSLKFVSCVNVLAVPFLSSCTSMCVCVSRPGVCKRCT